MLGNGGGGGNGNTRRVKADLLLLVSQITKNDDMTRLSSHTYPTNQLRLATTKIGRVR